MAFRTVSAAALSLCALVSCRPRERTAAPPSAHAWQAPDGPASATIADTSCDYFKSFVHPSPGSLMSEFVSRAGRGEFDHTEQWLPQALDCVGHEPGYDTFTIASGYSVARLDSMADTVRYLLTLHAIGDVSGRFESRRSDECDTVTLWRSTFGWRIRSPARWDWMLVGAALHKGLLRPTDTLSQAQP